jgi:hypothetical protein
MRDVTVSVPEMFFVAITRGLAGIGLGLIASEYVRPEARRPIGWGLLAIGLATTVPIAATLIGRVRHPMLSD